MYTGRSRGVDDGIDGGQLDYRLYGRGRVGGLVEGKRRGVRVTGTRLLGSEPGIWSENVARLHWNLNCRRAESIIVWL